MGKQPIWSLSVLKLQTHPHVSFISHFGP